MNNSISIEYPTFTLNNSTVILKPGSQFSINELRSRLHQMEVDSRNIDAKKELAYLYESTLRDDSNKFKLFDRLKKDTENYYAKMGISQSQNLPMPTRNEKINTERSKVINLRYASHNTDINNNPYEINNYEENSRNQQIKLRKPRNNNTVVNKRNAFYSNENNEQNEDNTSKQEEINNNKYIRHSRKFQNNETPYPELNNNDINNNIYNNNRNNNYNYNNNNNYQKQDIEYNNNINNKEKIYTNNPEDYTPYDDNKNINNINENNISMNNNEENIKMRAPDEESNFSLFSAFSSFKNNSKQICCHVLTGVIIICLALGILYLYRIFSESINGFFSYLFETVTHPGEIIASTFGVLRNYWYIIPIILICLIIIVSLLKNYKLKKRCEEIMKKIEDDLSCDEENRTISEEDIYRKYVQGYGISYKKYVKSYLPILRNMRRKNNRLKMFTEIIDGKDMMFWELNQ